MSKQIAPAIPALPPLSLVKDEATRRALQALADGWNVRNGSVGDGTERFLTEADVLSMASTVVISGLGLSGPSSPSAPGTGGSAGGGGTLSDLSVKLLEMLNLPVDLSSALAHAQEALSYLSAENNLSIARIQAMEDGFLSERTERIADGSALRSEVTGIKASVSNNYAAILEEQTVRVTQYDAMAQQITTLAAETDGNFAAVQTTLNAQSSELAAQASAITALGVEVDDNAAAILSEQTARATADGALASQITSVVATTNSKNSVFVQSTAPIAKAVNDLWINTSDGNRLMRWNGSSWVPADDGRVAQSLALINSETTARANADSALASDLTTVATVLNGNVATVQQHAQSINGIEAQWTIKTDVNGHVAGIGLMNDGKSSSFVVNATDFVVARPGYADRVPFQINSSGIFFNGTVSFANDAGKLDGVAGSTVVANAAAGASAGSAIGYWVRPNTTLIDGNKIYTGDAYVDTLQIKGNAVTVPVSATGGTSVSTASTDFGGGKVAVIVTASGSTGGAFGSSNETYSLGLQVKKNGSLLKTIDLGSETFYSSEGGGSGYVKASGAWVIQDTPSGSASYSATLVGDGPTTTGSCAIVALGVKR